MDLAPTSLVLACLTAHGVEFVIVGATPWPFRAPRSRHLNLRCRHTENGSRLLDVSCVDFVHRTSSAHV